MPQMMPLMWIISIFMWILLFSMLIDLYYYNQSFMILLNNKIEYKMNYLW